MRTVRQILEAKSVDHVAAVHAIPPEAPVLDAIRLMADPSHPIRVWLGW